MFRIKPILPKWAKELYKCEKYRQLLWKHLSEKGWLVHLELPDLSEIVHSYIKMIPIMTGFVFQETTEFVFTVQHPCGMCWPKQQLETVLTHSGRIFTSMDYMSSLSVEGNTKKKSLKLFQRNAKSQGIVYMIHPS